MMLPYDRFIDTREKRAHGMMFVFLVITIIFFIPYIILGCLLITRDSYQSIFTMLEYPILKSCYLSRVIVDVISQTQYGLDVFFRILISNIGGMEVLEAFVLILAYHQYSNKKRTTAVLLLQFLQFMVCSILTMIALKSGTLSQAVIYLRYIGGIFVVVNGITVAICLYDLFLTGKAYVKSLEYEVIEIKEHIDV